MGCLNKNRKGTNMEENIIKNDEKLDAIKDNFTPPGAKKKTESKADGKDEKDKSVTFTEDEVAKKVQSECDKLRTSYHKQIKDLQDQIAKLSPVEKTQAEIDVENRLAALEASEKAVAERERKIAVQEKLSGSGLDKALADYLKDDVDVDKLSALVEGIVKSRMKENGYVPSNHSSDDKVTPEEFKKWSYSKKEKFAQEHPESYKRLMGKK
jgi:hypothetical protein